MHISTLLFFQRIYLIITFKAINSIKKCLVIVVNLSLARATYRATYNRGEKKQAALFARFL